MKHLREGDWATPLAPGLGTWRSLATLKEKHLMKIPADLMPVEYAATWREMCVAYRLLEDSPELRPGDAVVVNGANGAVGAATLQLCALLKLRAVAVTRPRKGSNPKGSNPDGDEDSAGSNPAVDPKTTARLLALGAAEVLADEETSATRLSVDVSSPNRNSASTASAASPPRDSPTPCRTARVSCVSDA